MYLPWQGASGKFLIIIQACYLTIFTVVRIAFCLVLDFNANEFIGSNKKCDSVAVYFKSISLNVAAVWLLDLYFNCFGVLCD